jgi:hypothetical protein
MMLCAATMLPDTVEPQSGKPMPRRLDHLVICVHDLEQDALDWRKPGFNLTPTGVHPSTHGLALEFVGQEAG